MRKTNALRHLRLIPAIAVATDKDNMATGFVSANVGRFDGFLNRPRPESAQNAPGAMSAVLVPSALQSLAVGFLARAGGDS